MAILSGDHCHANRFRFCSLNISNYSGHSKRSLMYMAEDDLRWMQTDDLCWMRNRHLVCFVFTSIIHNNNLILEIFAITLSVFKKLNCFIQHSRHYKIFLLTRTILKNFRKQNWAAFQRLWEMRTCRRLDYLFC